MCSTARVGAGDFPAADEDRQIGKAYGSDDKGGSAFGGQTSDGAADHLLLLLGREALEGLEAKGADVGGAAEPVGAFNVE